MRYLVGGFKHEWIIFHIWDVILPIDELIFFRGVGIPPTVYNSLWRVLKNSCTLIMQKGRNVRSYYKKSCVIAFVSFGAAIKNKIIWFVFIYRYIIIYIYASGLKTTRVVVWFLENEHIMTLTDGFGWGRATTLKLPCTAWAGVCVGGDNNVQSTTSTSWVGVWVVWGGQFQWQNAHDATTPGTFWKTCLTTSAVSHPPG
jgi:hypothetical protein